MKAYSEFHGNIGREVTGIHINGKTYRANRILSALEHAAPAAEPVAALKAHIHRLIYAGDQFAAFDDTQTRDTADAWVNDRARWKVVRNEAERIALPAAPKHGGDQ